MPRIAVTGHMNIAPDSVDLIRRAIQDALREYEPDSLTGLSCIARGADAIFAEEVVRRGGRLEVIMPSEGYREAKVKPDDLPTFDRLMSLASAVRVLPFTEANRKAYEAANNVLIDESDAMIAVWDGEMGADKGSTASVVMEARSRGSQVRVIWPEGARRQ